MHRFTCGARQGVVISGMIRVTITQIVGQQAMLLIEAPASIGVVDLALYDRAMAAWQVKVDRAEQRVQPPAH